MSLQLESIIHKTSLQNMISNFFDRNEFENETFEIQ